MGVIQSSVEIERSPEEVFAYLDDLDRHGEWQEAITRSRTLTPGPVGVGSRAVDTRLMGRREQDVTYEIVEHAPPTKVVFRGVDGPIRPHGTVTVEPLDDGRRSRVTIRLELVGHGLGRLIAPLASRQARVQVPVDQRRLKEVLEGR